MRPFRLFGPGLVVLTLTFPAQALVTAPVGGRAGEVDATLRLTLERGKVEPLENSDSWQTADWELYTVGAGYTFGDLAFLKDSFFRIEYTYYDSPAEVNETGAVAAADCLGENLGAGRCQFHPADQGHLISPQFGFNLIHEPRYTFGLFGQFIIPIGVDFDKFVLPRTDFFGFGPSVGVRFLPWLTYESRVFVGTGPLQGGQNSTVAILNYFGFEAERWLLPWKIGARVGPYFDADLSERFDPIYDAAYVSGVPEPRDAAVITPATTRDRIRMMRFGVSLMGYLVITRHVALEAGYTQKLFGYDTPATQFYTFGLRGAY